MGNTTKRVKGKIEELAGKAKAGVGKTIGNEQMQVEGKARELTGKARLEVAKAAERARAHKSVAHAMPSSNVGLAVRAYRADGRWRLLRPVRMAPSRQAGEP
jgi:uncharacterized protein YjbJ (UPF0337 family)